jgi:hypothetical protein
MKGRKAVEAMALCATASVQWLSMRTKFCFLKVEADSFVEWSVATMFK